MRSRIANGLVLIAALIGASLGFPTASTARPITDTAAAATWLVVSTPNIVVYSDAGEPRTRELAEQLEGFRQLLVSLFPRAVAASRAGRVVVVAFKDDLDFGPFKPLVDGQPIDVAGQFFAGSEQTMILLDAASFDGDARVVLHEYVHHLFAGSDSPIPLWFDEGVAEFYSTAIVEAKRAQIGKIIQTHVKTLHDRGPMPLEALFGVKTDSLAYNEANRQGSFYATAWALVHYCILDASGDRTRRLLDFAARQGKGEPVETAFKASFGSDMGTVDKALTIYSQRNSFPLSIVALGSPVDVAKSNALTAQAAALVEVEYYLGEALAFEQRFDEAESHFEKGMAADPSSSLPFEGLGFVAIRRNDLSKARLAFAEAAKRDSKSYLSLYYLAATSMDDVDVNEKAAANVRALLERVVVMNPDFAPAYGPLASIVLNGGDAAGAARWAERGLALDGRNGRLRSTLGLALIRLGRVDEAKVNLTKVIESSPDSGTRAYARALLDSIERQAVEGKH